MPIIVQAVFSIIYVHLRNLEQDSFVGLDPGEKFGFFVGHYNFEKHLRRTVMIDD